MGDCFLCLSPLGGQPSGQHLVRRGSTGHSGDENRDRGGGRIPGGEGLAQVFFNERTQNFLPLFYAIFPSASWEGDHLTLLRTGKTGAVPPGASDDLHRKRAVSVHLLVGHLDGQGDRRLLAGIRCKNGAPPSFGVNFAGLCGNFAGLFHPRPLEPSPASRGAREREW